ncbi:MAG: hypothetical protein A3F41_04160 [Coxiella sp. RIFCSPHIGHO2_12_FULL_44_14]|nr:MAG: hypothetical protein A3F41_04160 [Coxiella sp. RIFCSPHIGHO2_12_FULL_44_14]
MVNEQSLQRNYVLRKGLVGIVAALVANGFQISFFGWIWMAITIYMVTDFRYGMTMRACINRVLGAISGTLLGFFAAVIFNQTSVLSLCLGLFLIGAVSGFAISKNKSFQLIGMNAVVVFTMAKLPALHLSAWRLAFERSFDNILGVAIVLMVSAIVFVGYSYHTLKERIINLCQSNQHWLAEIKKYFMVEKTAIIPTYFSDQNKSLAEIQLLLLESQYESSEIDPKKLSETQQLIETLEKSSIILYLLVDNLNQHKKSFIIDQLKAEMASVITHIESMWSYFSVNFSVSSAEYTVLITKTHQSLLDLTERINELRSDQVFSEQPTEDLSRFYQTYILFEHLIALFHR